MNTIELNANDGHRFAAYVVRPTGAPRGGLVIIQEFFGVNGHIRRVCDQYANDGYLVISPAIFDRVERNVELSYDEVGMSKGRELRAKLNLDNCMKDIQAAIEAGDPASAIGFAERAVENSPTDAGFRALLNSFLPRKRAISQMLMRDPEGRVLDRKSTRLNSSHIPLSRMPSSA